MVGSFTHGRVYVFIDAANMFYSQRTLHWRIDYTKLKEYLKRECDLRRLWFYTGSIKDDEKQVTFLNKLRGLGYQIRIKEVKRIKIGQNGYRLKGNLDIELTIDALKYSDAFDTCILMSGDSDFAPLLDELKDKGKHVIVVSTKHHISRELVERAKYINLKKLRDKISYGK